MLEFNCYHIKHGFFEKKNNMEEWQKYYKIMVSLFCSFCCKIPYFLSDPKGHLVNTSPEQVNLGM